MENSPYRDTAVADAYERLAVPLQFAAPARDLVAAVRLRAGQRVLDVGTGTGPAARAAAAAVGPAGCVIGIDPSLEMLARLGEKGAVKTVAARAPDLPFRDSSFDAVIANFVLSHVENVAHALSQMVCVLRPGGALGVTSWGAGATPVSSLWSELVARFTSAAALQREFETVIPWDRWFSNGTNLHKALTEAGLRDVEIACRDYSVTVSAADYASMKEGGVEGVLLRRQLGEPGWQRFRDALVDGFRARFGGSLTYARDAYIAAGTRPVGWR